MPRSTFESTIRSALAWKSFGTGFETRRPKIDGSRTVEG